MAKNRLFYRLVEHEGIQRVHLLLHTKESQEQGVPQRQFLKGAVFMTEVQDNFELG